MLLFFIYIFNFKLVIIGQQIHLCISLLLARNHFEWMLRKVRLKYPTDATVFNVELGLCSLKLPLTIIFVVKRYAVLTYSASNVVPKIFFNEQSCQLNRSYIFLYINTFLQAFIFIWRKRLCLSLFNIN